ncbi:MAG: SRPBCC family protein [Desulfobacula sp.]|jgi:hypothetical protein|uniref:SRPBCC family protein n=1 Tax=Desulfobacula sp. TaxID=2593537 RepID=UPI001DCB8465|nr:SRPBCC family protein [Desulfobacula sp.]MBT3487455.1 SRPBCC family protein [Desulfobacula sp.]MBT3807579.1 SRPBCC family protein [Desulfobacula sp.]MBT4027303.1 SRPBCC family protein [Desulfobacula sp.]MBT4201140.1 SRPBCC family protein [Desulfobacula sp.]
MKIFRAFLIIIVLIPLVLIVKSSMTTYDVTDEAIINASSDVVFKALGNEFAGKTSWWMPHLSSKLREGYSLGETGAIYDIIIHGKRPLKFTYKSLEIKKNEMSRGIYIEGAFRGESIYKLEDIEGKTKLSLRWRVKPSGLVFKIFAPFFPIEKSHSDVMQYGFKNLNKYLDKRS